MLLLCLNPKHSLLELQTLSSVTQYLSRDFYTCTAFICKSWSHRLSAHYKDISCHSHLKTGRLWMRCCSVCVALCMRELSSVWEALQSVSKTYLWVMLQRARTKVHTSVAAKAPHRDPWEAVDHVSWQSHLLRQGRLSGSRSSSVIH